MHLNRSPFVRIALLGLLGLTTLFLATNAKAGKKKVKPPQTVESFRYVYSGEGEPKQDIGKITIETKSLINQDEDYPEIFAFTDEEFAAADGIWKQLSGNPAATISNKFLYPKDKTVGKHWVNILGHPGGEMALAAFWVKVTNNTDHILNFSKDSKLYFKDGLHEEPIKPMASYDAMVQWLITMEKDYDQNRKKGLLSLGFPFGLSPSLFMMRFGRTGDTGFVNKDVLPGFGASGLLLFPATLGKAVSSSNEIEVLFYEVPSETNTAGDITARSRCAFKFKQVPVKFWFDKDQSHWTEGEPPTPGEE